MKTSSHLLRVVIFRLLDVLGGSGRRSPFTAARNPESRRRFALYVSRVQPALAATPPPRSSRLLGAGGAVSRGLVRHAPESDGPESPRPRIHSSLRPEVLAWRRRAAAAGGPSTPVRSLLDALRVR